MRFFVSLESHQALIGAMGVMCVHRFRRWARTRSGMRCCNMRNPSTSYALRECTFVGAVAALSDLCGWGYLRAYVCHL